MASTKLPSKKLLLIVLPCDLGISIASNAKTRSFVAFPYCLAQSLLKQGHANDHEKVAFNIKEYKRITASNEEWADYARHFQLNEGAMPVSSAQGVSLSGGI